MIRVLTVLFEEPVLDRRQRHRTSDQILLGFADRNVVVAVDDGREAGDRLVLKNLFRRKLQPGLPRSHDDLNADYRIAAQVEKVVLAANLLNAQELAPYICKRLLDAILWRGIGILQLRSRMQRRGPAARGVVIDHLRMV